MIRKVTLFPEIARPLGFEPTVLEGLGSFTVLFGANGSGKTRLLDCIRWLHDLVPRSKETRALLHGKLAEAVPARRESLNQCLRLVDRLAQPGSILVDGDSGLRHPNSEDRCIDLTYRTEDAPSAIAATFPDLPPPMDGASFAVAYQNISAYVGQVATALFDGRSSRADKQPLAIDAFREAERFNEIARALLDKEVSLAVDSEGRFENDAYLGNRRFQRTELSRGEGLLLAWAILLHEQAKSLAGAVVVIDEPELHLHPAIQDHVLSRLRRALGERGQLWVVTHSLFIAGRSDVTNRFLVERGTVRPFHEGLSRSNERALGLVVDKAPLSFPSTSRDSAMFQSTFLSYGGPDAPFAQKLNDALRKNGVDTYFFPKDAIPGQKLHRLMREGINRHDRIILVCSRGSLVRPGVLNEITEALQREARDGGKEYLIPITLDDYVFDGWEPHDPGLAQAIKDRVVADFRGAETDPGKFTDGLLRLIAALKK